MRTPMLEDKRFIITAWVATAVLTLSAVGKEPSGGVLGFLGTLLTVFMTQSQWGQTKRATTPAPPPV